MLGPPTDPLNGPELAERRAITKRAVHSDRHVRRTRGPLLYDRIPRSPNQTAVLEWAASLTRAEYPAEVVLVAVAYRPGYISDGQIGVPQEYERFLMAHVVQVCHQVPAR